MVKEEHAAFLNWLQGVRVATAYIQYETLIGKGFICIAHPDYDRAEREIKTFLDEHSDQAECEASAQRLLRYSAFGVVRFCVDRDPATAMTKLVEILQRDVFLKMVCKPQR